MRLVLAGLLLGILSRVEETTDGLAAVVSTHATWVLVPFAAGALAGRIGSGARAGVVVLTAANAGYYAWMRTVAPADTVGPVAHWILAGIGAGAAAGAVGGAARGTSRLARLAAPAAVGAVVAGDQLGAFAAVLP